MKEYCVYCDKDVEYEIETVNLEITIKGEHVKYSGEIPKCCECHEQLYISSFEDKLTSEANRQYRIQIGLITTGEIIELLDMYNIGKKPLAPLLGWGDKTIIRYIEGKTPIRAFSDQLIKLKNPHEMELVFNKHKDRLSPVAAKKLSTRIQELKLQMYIVDTSSVFNVVNFFLNHVDNESGITITPLKLQKLLYYAQAWSLAFNDSKLFDESICAWIHGPVIQEVYHAFKVFGYQPLEHTPPTSKVFNLKELEVLNMVWDVYGKYDAKYLEALTHAEHPWKNARVGYSVQDKCEVEISVEMIETYYKSMIQNHKIVNTQDLNAYVSSIEPNWS